jgi:oligopeptide transport system permease protein
MQLYGNYLYGADGELVYSRAAGGSGDDAERTVRVLYYNYYRYKNGRYPSYVFGTDSQGYDLASRLAVGVALSLMLAFSVSLINLVIGALWGAVSGYYGGVLDLVMSRVTDVLSGVPAIVVQTLFQIHLAERVGVLVSLLFAFVLTGWIATAGRVRSQFYRFKGEEYVSAARTLGASDRRIIWRHIFPNTLGTLITASVLVIPGVIFTESMLSFLGIVNLGGADITSLGTLLSEAANVWTLAPHLMLVPAAFISLLMISFNLLGGGLRDAFNPTLRGTL